MRAKGVRGSVTFMRFTSPVRIICNGMFAPRHRPACARRAQLCNIPPRREQLRFDGSKPDRSGSAVDHSMQPRRSAGERDAGIDPGCRRRSGAAVRHAVLRAERPHRDRALPHAPGAHRRPTRGRRAGRHDLAADRAKAFRGARQAVLRGEPGRRRRQYRHGYGGPRAPADGYTIMIASSTFMINPSLYGKVPYDPVKDFDPVTIAATTPNVLVVHKSVPANSVTEFVELVRGGRYNSYATPGAGTPSHLSGELFKLALKLDLTAVPFHGGGTMIQSVLGGHTPVAFSSLPPAAPLIREGAVRALAVTTAKRVSLLPDVPTLEEAGYPGQEGDTPQCVLVPAGTPRAIVDLLHREILRIIALPEVKERFAAIGFEPIGTTPEEFAARIKVEVPRWAKIIRDANIKVD